MRVQVNIKMANLIYYMIERKEFAEAFDKKLTSSKEAIIIINKLLRHFKLNLVQIYFTSGRNHSNARKWKITINFENCDFGTICHEVAHVYQFQKLMNSGYENWHNKEHKKLMKRMINYCKKRDWFSQELDRRTTIKIKPEASKEEIRANELIKLQQKIIKYEKKILFFQRKLSKAKRSYNIRRSKLQGKLQINREVTN
jgi:hypothetical protein